MVEVTVAAWISHVPCLTPNSFHSISNGKSRNKTTKVVPTSTKAWKIRTAVAAASCSSSVFGSFNQTVGGQVLREGECKKRVFFLDVNPLCYAGNKPSLQSFGHWVSLFFSQVCLTDPVIAVFDGDNCNELRRRLLPSYKAHRRKFFPQSTISKKYVRGQVGRSQQLIMDVLRKCNVPNALNYDCGVLVSSIICLGYIETNCMQIAKSTFLERGYHVVIASPDKDFKQLISENVQIVMPLVELKRWSFYTLKHYMAQYYCDPQSDLSLRCIMGDEVDGVPGIQHLVPGFGRRTALKLLKKHGSLENLLNAASVRTVGRQYAQEALTKYADYLRRNYEVLALRRDVDVHLQEEWLLERDTSNDANVLSNFFRLLEETNKSTRESRSNFSNG
ncbi:hypothetical protein ES332_D05G306300v1 [Gossypium tomentosum]|uniref:5'-3' exonuclease domain-containing protein n=1 Tax=Gossypium tomentosum TaxID=34277 RepID=A0A5D2L284_GOSTO|nr:hypothetical protein ES332_D05G306300v1 [Gossypium tomentosum]